MKLTAVKFLDWIFEVDCQATRDAYRQVKQGGADDCGCDDCLFYLSVRDAAFPDSVHELFRTLGIDYPKEVEVTNWYTEDDGGRCIGGWFHFKGRILSGKTCDVPVTTGDGYLLELTVIDDHFSIGFAENNTLTFFEEKSGLVQVEFEAKITAGISNQ